MPANTYHPTTLPIHPSNPTTIVEGILDQRPLVHTAPANFDDCKWQICTPNQYSAAKELQVTHSL